MAANIERQVGNAAHRIACALDKHIKEHGSIKPLMLTATYGYVLDAPEHFEEVTFKYPIWGSDYLHKLNAPMGTITAWRLIIFKVYRDLTFRIEDAFLFWCMWLAFGCYIADFF